MNDSAEKLMRAGSLCRCARNERGIVLVTAVLVLAVLIIMGTTAFFQASTDIKLSTNYKTATQAIYIADAGIERAREELRTTVINNILKGADTTIGNSDDGLLSFGASAGFGGGTFAVRVTNNTTDPTYPLDSDSRLIIRSTGTINRSTRTIEANVNKTVPSPGRCRGAITTNGPIGSLGTMNIDGRDHSISGTLLSPAVGTLAVATKSTYERGGNSKLGGIDKIDGTEVTLTKTDFENVIEEHATWDYITSPDNALQLPEGYLKAVAQSGFGGSQYVTDPAQLQMPLKGVTYVELPSGGVWQAVDYGDGYGVLVVHNSATNAILKNTNGGSFKGVIIADDYVHIHNTLIGAVVNLTTAPSEGNCIGNGSGDALYSAEAIGRAFDSIITVEILSWRDVY